MAAAESDNVDSGVEGNTETAIDNVSSYDPPVDRIYFDTGRILGEQFDCAAVDGPASAGFNGGDTILAGFHFQGDIVFAGGENRFCLGDVVSLGIGRYLICVAAGNAFELNRVVASLVMLGFAFLLVAKKYRYRSVGYGVTAVSVAETDNYIGCLADYRDFGIGSGAVGDSYRISSL